MEIRCQNLDCGRLGNKFRGAIHKPRLLAAGLEATGCLAGDGSVKLEIRCPRCGTLTLVQMTAEGVIIKGTGGHDNVSKHFAYG
jgi:hypothetical protein